MVKVITPVTVHDGKQYVAPGTEIDLPEDEAKRLIEVHGEYGGAARPQDPANTQVLNVMDAASLDGLNTAASIHGGHGSDAPSLNRRSNTVTGDPSKTSAKDPLPNNAELEGMNKAELIALAHKRNVPLETDATKPEIIAELKKSAK